MKILNCYAKPGTKVKCAYPNNGYSGDREHIKKLGIDNKMIFTVDYINVYGYSSTVYFIEMPGVAFNTVNFEEIK